VFIFLSRRNNLSTNPGIGTDKFLFRHCLNLKNGRSRPLLDNKTEWTTKGGPNRLTRPKPRPTDSRK